MKNDTQIQQDVRDELKWDARVTPTDIGVSVKLGLVTLTCPPIFRKRWRQRKRPSEFRASITI